MIWLGGIRGKEKLALPHSKPTCTIFEDENGTEILLTAKHPSVFSNLIGTFFMEENFCNDHIRPMIPKLCHKKPVKY